jgi:flavin-binding protein dodecin
MNPIEKLVNPKFSRDVIKLLRSRGWSDTKIARTIRSDVKFVRLVASAQASFSMRHLNAIARASESNLNLLIFEALEPRGLKSQMRESFVSLREMIDSTGALKRAPVRKSTRKRSDTQAA